MGYGSVVLILVFMALAFIKPYGRSLKNQVVCFNTFISIFMSASQVEWRVH